MLEEMWYDYDAKGNLITTETLSEPYSVYFNPGLCTHDTSRHCNLTTMGYDAFGNVVSITDDLGRITETAYDPATNIYPYVVTSAKGTNLQRRVGSVYDPGCGVLRWKTLPYTSTALPDDPSLLRSETAYDEFCRPVRTAGPDDHINFNFRQLFQYHLGGHPAAGGIPVPTKIRVYTREPNHAVPWFVSSWTLTDAMGRLIQKQSEAVVEGTLTKIASSTVRYDSVGNPTVAYAPFGPVTGGVFQDPVGSPKVESSFDVLGRVTQVKTLDGYYRKSDHLTAWQTTTTDECYNASGCTGGKTVEIRDGQGNVVEKQWYEEDGSTGTLAAKTKYTYDGLRRLLSSEQWNGSAFDPDTKITTSYDTLGRKRSVDDPDSGFWQYFYDAVGNLRVQEDPRAGQHLQFCYDDLNRMTRKHHRSTDFSGTLASCTGNYNPAVTTAYTYDGGSGQIGLGHLALVNGPAGGTAFEYDERGRVIEATKSILDVDSNIYSATFTNAYDDEHLTDITYPGGEVVSYTYNDVGQVTSVGGTVGNTYTEYLSNLTYDIYGRPKLIEHGNGVTDTRGYYPADENARLKSIEVAKGPQMLLDYNYVSYSPTGMLTSLDDERVGPGYPTIASAAATYTYDGLGRLATATHPDLGASPPTYSYHVDRLGNLEHKEGIDYDYENQAKPHQVTFVDNLVVNHDNNGNRTSPPGAASNTYEYDAENRLKTISAAETVSFRYDHTGTRVLKSTDASSEFYFSELMETRSNSVGSEYGLQIKHYFAGGMRIASRRVGPWWMYSQLPSSSDTMLARVLKDLGPAQTRKLVMLAFGVGMFAIITVPGRRQRVVGIVIRRGHLLAVTLVFLTSTTPALHLCLGAGPALAGGGGGGGSGPTPTPIGSPVDEVYHYHQDRLGSTHLVTDDSGGVVEHIRYMPFGEVRGSWLESGLPSGTDERYLFTGYEREEHSGLYYAGARFYDAEMGMFLSHDPAAEFPNPYTYVHWNPVNATDPTGAAIDWFAVLTAAVIGSIAGASAAGFNALANGATWEKTFLAAGIGQQIGGVSGFVGSVGAQQVVPAAVKLAATLIGTQVPNAKTVASAISAGSFLASAGQATRGLGQGDYSGVIGMALSIGIATAWARTSNDSTTTPPGSGRDGEVEALVLNAGDTSKSSWGHLATRIDGRVWSYGTDGWHETPYSLDQYLENNSYRDALGLNLDLSPAELAIFRSSFENTVSNNYSYNPLWCNCTDPLEVGLESAGISLGINVTPYGLGEALIGSGVVTSVTYYPAAAPAARGGGIVRDLRSFWSQQ